MGDGLRRCFVNRITPIGPGYEPTKVLRHNGAPEWKAEGLVGRSKEMGVPIHSRRMLALTTAPQ
jgi:hypothetical protein